MKPIQLLVVCLFFLNLFPLSQGMAQLSSEPFAFSFEGKVLHGLIERPQDQPAQAMVVLIPGYGPTNFVEGNWFGELRQQLVSMGLSVVCWDKMGCGQSEGTFDAQQAVTNSAAEALIAIQTLQRQQVAGVEKLGLWGLSRAGWICPLINEQFPVEFWISVSGTDDKENYGYLLQSNLLIHGKEAAEAERLYQAWRESHRLLSNQAPYEPYLQAIHPLQADSLCRSLFGYSEAGPITEADRQAYVELQQSYTQDGHFDSAIGLWVYLEDFDQLLGQVQCPVLALFGANDSQVDWRKTKSLYEATIGTRLTVQVFDQCNHSLQKCETCAFQEDLSALRWQACDGYYEAMEGWLQEIGIIE